MRCRLIILFAALTLRAGAQDATDTQVLLKQLLQRLDALEQKNRALVQDVHALRQELHDSQKQDSSAVQTTPTAESALQKEEPPLEDRVAVNERRISEQAQTKVEASQKFPISLNGMLLFNAFANSASPKTENAGEYGLLTGPNRSGATLRQTLLGLTLQGPSLPGGGRVNGSLLMDFWGGYSAPGANWFRLRRADVSLDWKNRSFTVGQDKPLIAPYQPDSLAEVGVPPLAGAGNFWLWLPQARYEERVPLGPDSGFTGQVAFMQTAENYAAIPSQYSASLEQARPALEGRVAFWHRFDDTRRFEIGSGFHTSTTHFAGYSVPSRIASLDWRAIPFWKIKLTGTVYTGQNVANLGALGNEFSILNSETVQPLHAAGGWAQVSVPILSRLSLNVFGGLEDDHGAYSSNTTIARNLIYASNLMYHLGPNVIIGMEGLQVRSRSFAGSNQLHNHYDLALGYLF